jgi:hypothetical protein
MTRTQTYFWQRIPFDTGPGAETVNTELEKIDISGARKIRLDLTVDKSDTDAGDTYDVYFQEADDGGFWHDRGHFEQITGSMSPSSTAPEIRTLVISCDSTIDSTEESYEPSGSAGGSRLAAGTVRNGPFLGVRKDTTGRLARHRIQWVVVDGDSNGDFEGNVTLHYEM